MRNTSFRRRSGLRVHSLPEGVGSAKPRYKAKDLRVPDGTPDSIVCTECGGRFPMLTNGRPVGHGPSGSRPNLKQGEYRCEGSGRF